MATSESNARVGSAAAGTSAARADAPSVGAAPTWKRHEEVVVGGSEASRKLAALIAAAARSELPVWVSGPPGSDREGVARAIHAASARARVELAMVECAALPEALQERTLFGCSAGHYPAIPGAHAGVFESAASTTLFVDGIDALRAPVRDKLLHAASVRRFRREGESQDRALAARLVLASGAETPSPLAQVPHHELNLVPLAKRREDILALAGHFLRDAAEDAGVRAVGFTGDARDALLEEPWRGDVRELRERIRTAVRLNGSGAIGAEALLLARAETPSFKEAKRAFERRYVSALLRRCEGNISRAARLARKDRKDFYDVLRRTGIDPTSFRE